MFAALLLPAFRLQAVLRLREELGKSQSRSLMKPLVEARSSN